MFSHFSYSIAHENFVFSLIFQPMQDNSAIWPGIKISYVWLVRAFLIFWERFADICAAINSRLGIVKFLFANLLLLIIKLWLILFGWYITAYATVHSLLILASLKRCISIFFMLSLTLIDLGISILMFRPSTHFTHLFSISSRCPKVFSNHKDYGIMFYQLITQAT